MKFYVYLWMDTGLTLSDLGRWEQENPFEYESYISAYMKMKLDQIERSKRLRQGKM